MSGEQIPQLTRRALDRMSPEQIIAAKKAGQLEALRRGESGDVDDPGTRSEQITDLAGMSPEQIVKARREGRLDDLAKGIGAEAVYE